MSFIRRVSLLPSRFTRRQFSVTTELPKDLPASTAGRSQSGGIGGHGDPFELAGTLRNRFEHRDALSAQGQSVGSVLDVAAGVDSSVFGFKSSANFEVREGCVSMFAGLDGRLQKSIHQSSSIRA